MIRRRLGDLWRDYSLSIVLGGLFVASWLLHWWTSVPLGGETQEAGPALKWWVETFANWQSEFLQLFSFVVLGSILVHKGSPESKDSDEDLKAIMLRVEARLRAMQSQLPPDRRSHRGR